MDLVSFPVAPSLPPPPLPVTYMSQAPLPPPPLPAPLLPPSAPPSHASLEQTNGDESVEVQHFPQPRSRMRRLQWTKIPANRIAGRRTLWTGAERVLEKMDFERMEELFALPAQSPVVGVGAGGKGGAKYEDAMKKGRTRTTEEINILDSRRSLNVNVFLRQFRMSHSDLVQLLTRADSRSLGCEKLRGLLRILPNEDEVIQLKNYAGQRSRLGNAERFCLELMDLPSYAVKVEAMLVKEEFIQTVSDRVKPALNAAILSVKDLNSNKALHEILHMVLMTGNFLNSGASSGNAAGFRLSSLLNLTEIRSNKPKMTLLHYVAWEAEKKNPELLHFPEQLSHLKECSEYSLESLKAEVHSLAESVASVSEKLKQTEPEFQQIMAPFIKYSKEQLVDLEKSMAELQALRLELAAYLCEEETTFKLDECIKVFQSFCEKFIRAVKENNERTVEEKSCEKRRKSVEAAQIRRQLRMNLDAAEDVDVFVGALLSESALHSPLSRRWKNRSQSVSDFGRICDGYMIRGDECICLNDEMSNQKQCRSRASANNNIKEHYSCFESKEGVAMPLNDLPTDRVEFSSSDTVGTSSIVGDKYSGSVYSSGPERGDRMVRQPVDVSENLGTKINGKRNSRSRLRRFAASFDDGRERKHTVDRDFGQREIHQEKSKVTKADLTGRWMHLKTNSVDGSTFNSTTCTDSFSEVSGEAELPQIGDREFGKNRPALDAASTFCNGGQKEGSLEETGVSIGLKETSPDGVKLPFGVVDVIVSVSKSGEEKNDEISDSHEMRNNWELNSEMNVFEHSKETCDKLTEESHRRNEVEMVLLRKSGTEQEIVGHPLNKKQSANEQELVKKESQDILVVHPERKSAVAESDRDVQRERNKISMKNADVDMSVEDSVTSKDIICSYSDVAKDEAYLETIEDPPELVLIDETIAPDDNNTENPCGIMTVQYDTGKYSGTKNIDYSIPSLQLVGETSDLLENELPQSGTNDENENHQADEAGSAVYKKTHEKLRVVSLKQPRLSDGMKNRLQELSQMYSESENEDWFSSPVKKSEHIGGIRKGTLKGTLLCDITKLSEFLCSCEESDVQKVRKEDRVKKDAKITSQTSPRKTHPVSSAADARSSLPRISSSPTSSRRNYTASNMTLPMSSSTSLAKRVAKPVMPRTQPSKATDLPVTKTKADQKINTQRLFSDLKDANVGGASKKVISVASPLIERKEVRKPVQTSVFTRHAVSKTAASKRPSIGGDCEGNTLRLYIRSPASSKGLKLEESKCLASKTSHSISAISRLRKTPEQPCSDEQHQETKTSSANKESSRNLSDSKPTQKTLSSVALTKARMSRAFGFGSSKQLTSQRKSTESNTLDLQHALSSTSISRNIQSIDAKHPKATQQFGSQQNSTNSKALEDHKSTYQDQPGSTQGSNCAKQKQFKTANGHQFTPQHKPRISQSEYQQVQIERQFPLTHSETLENFQIQSSLVQLIRTTQSDASEIEETLTPSQRKNANTCKDQYQTNNEHPTISKPTAKVAPLKLNTVSASGLPRKSSTKSVLR